MSYNIYITNLSYHDQEFEMNGFNENQNIIVSAGRTSVINTAEGSTGAIIALHNGVRCEQAEINRDGADGAISIDINYIMGAGGNLTIQQVNNPASSKGDPLFMQHLNTAWEASDFITKMSLQPCVYLNSYGNIRRIEAISDYHRSCADGLTYRCVDPSSANFDNTSSALQVGAHIQITYNDGDASAPVPPIPPLPQWSLSSTNPTDARKTGVTVNNFSSSPQTYTFYATFPNLTGTYSACFSNPGPTVILAPYASEFIPLPPTYTGRVQRGTQLPATWVEFRLTDPSDGAAHGIVNLEQGCDGAAIVRATDGSGGSHGFTNDIVSGAPEDAVMRKADGTRALAATVSNWLGIGNSATILYERRKLGWGKAKVNGDLEVFDVVSGDGCLTVDFY